MKKFLIVPLVLILIIGAWILYQQSLTQSSYNGLPTVPCIDTTQPITQSYSFHITITIHNQNFPLDTTIGHDYGKCLHDIFVKDTSGTVFVETNVNEAFTLGDFFNVWHKTFDAQQLMSYVIGNGHSCDVFVNGERINTYNNTPIKPHEDIQIVYK